MGIPTVSPALDFRASEILHPDHVIPGESIKNRAMSILVASSLLAKLHPSSHPFVPIQKRPHLYDFAHVFRLFSPTTKLRLLSSSSYLRNLLPHIPIQTLNKSIKDPLRLALLREHGAVFADPIPFHDAEFLLLGLQISGVAEADEPRVLNPLLVRVATLFARFHVVGDAADRFRQTPRGLVLGHRVLIAKLFERGTGIVTVSSDICRTGREAVFDPLLFFLLAHALFDRVENLGVAFEEEAEEALFREDGPFGEGEGAALVGGDDGVAHVRDEDRHGGDGDERPDDEEGLAGVGFGGEVTVADGEEGDVAEVERFEVGEVLSVVLGFPEDDGADAPEETDWEAISFRRFVECVCDGHEAAEIDRTFSHTIVRKRAY